MSRTLVTWTLLTLLATLAPLATSSAASAAEATASAQAVAIDPETGDPLYPYLFRGDVGLGSAVGLLGFSVGLQHRPWLRTELGLGFGASGLQVSAMSVFSFGSYRHRFTTGAGVSVGTAFIGLDTFLNVDAAGYEYNGRGGFFFAGAAGLTVPLVSAGEPLSSRRTFLGPTPAYPQFRLGLGLRF